MNKSDIIIWYRAYLPTGGGTDFQMNVLDYRSFDELESARQEMLDSVGADDWEPVDWDFLTNGYVDEEQWNNFNELFEVSKEYGIPPRVIIEAGDGYDSFKEYVENAYRGQADSVLDYTHELLDDVGITDDMAESYFDWDAFGYALDVNGDLSMLILDDWEDRYESQLEAEAVYEEISSMRNEDIAEWYVDMIGSVQELGMETLKTFFDYKKFARDLGYEGYSEVGGYIWSPY